MTTPAPSGTLRGRSVLLIVSGGIAAFKSLELVRLLAAAGCTVRCVLTEAGAQFVTPLSLQALSLHPVHTTLWSLTDESEMGHIALSRSADLLVVCPASADILSRMAAGAASDLASTLLLATDTPVLVAPAMNVRMWLHPATQNNVATLRARGIRFVGPDEGIMACNEFGPGRLVEPPVVVRAIADTLRATDGDNGTPDSVGVHAVASQIVPGGGGMRGVPPDTCPPPEDGRHPEAEPGSAHPAITPPRTRIASVLGSSPTPPTRLGPTTDSTTSGASPADVTSPATTTTTDATLAGAPTIDSITTGATTIGGTMTDAITTGATATEATLAAATTGATTTDAILAGRHALVTAGPTHEPIDPVRFIANRSSGRQGYAIAGALARRGARVTLVSGPTALPTPPGVVRIDVDTAEQMLSACNAALPAEIAVFTAAVADWRVEHPAPTKLKKRTGEPPAPLALVLNPDILFLISRPGPRRPALVVGFAAETDAVLDHAADKLVRKGCDWIVANDVADGSGIMGGDQNEIHLLTAAGTESWPRLHKSEVADRLAGRIAAALAAPLAGPQGAPRAAPWAAATAATPADAALHRAGDPEPDARQAGHNGVAGR